MGITETITAVASAIAQGAQLAQPAVDAWAGNRFLRLQEDLANEWTRVAQSGSNGDDVVFVTRLLSECGHPPGIVSTNHNLAIPAAHLNQFVNAAIELTVLKAQLAALEQAARKGISQP